MRIIPAPKSISYLDGDFVFSAATTLKCLFKNLKNNFNDFLFKMYGFTLNEGNDVLFFIDETLELSDEGYVLELDDIAKISAKTEKGLFYGLQTLKQLIVEHYRKDKNNAVIQKLIIEDDPRFSYRGFMFDCARHFFPTDIVKTYIDAISLFKMNVFHWHLTEDQGWRVQIDAFPKLTEIGSTRSETMGDGTPHGGFYTKEQIADVVKYAADRYVQVIPEFDMPGHSRAAIAAYPELSCKGEKIDVSTKFGIHREILCGGKDETYSFIYSVLSEFAEMFPSGYVHLGGDEAIKLEWYNCENCQKKIAALKLGDEEGLQAYMTNQAVSRLKTLNKTAICWNESANSETLDDSVVLQYWQDGKRAENVTREVKSGRKIIVSKFNPYYLDYPYAMHSLKAAYSFEPVYDAIKDYESNVLGVESPIWTEWVDTKEVLADRVWPRLIAVAETGWTEPSEKDYRSFTSALPVADGMLKTLYNIDVAPAEKCNPGAIAKPFLLAKFGIKMFDFEMIGRSITANKEVKKMRASRGKVKK